MSVLLEALKRAALEKKAGDDESAPHAERESSTPVSGSVFSPQPAMEEPPESEPVTEIVSEDFEIDALPDDSEELEIEELLEVDEDETEPPLLDIEDIVGSQPDTEFSIEASEQEIEAEKAREAELTRQREEEKREQERIETERQQLEQARLAEEQSRLENEQREREEQERQAEAQRLEQARLAEEALEQQEEARKQEESRRLEEEIEAREAERKAKEEEERERLEHQRLAEEAAKSEAEAERIRAENDTALTTLVHNGHEISRKQKRRSRFLYLLLVMTAVGGIVAYYFYLLGANNHADLLGFRKGGLPQTELRDMRHEVAAEVSAEASRAREVIQEGVITDLEPANSDLLQEAQGGELSGESATSEPDSGANFVDELVAGSGIAAEATDAIVDATAIQSVAGDALDLIDTVEQRVDVPPSINQIVNQLQGLSNNLNVNAAVNSPTVEPETTDPGPAETISNSVLSAGDQTREPERVHIYHKPVPTELSNLIQRAYSAYQIGEFETARRHYGDALRLSPTSRDALLGAAAVASALGNHSEAFNLYQVRLNHDPSDSYARAGILALSSRAAIDPADIDRMLEDSPQAAHLHFLKGVAHASLNEWESAQAAFYEAHHWDKTNPDYAYNLAVSLDHLAQSSAALRFYRQALMLAESQVAGFSMESAKQRMSELGGGE